MIKISKKVIFLKKQFNTCDIDVDKILSSRKVPYGEKISFKYFLRYNDDNDIYL